MPNWLGGVVAAGAFAALLTTAVRGSRWSWLGVGFLGFYSLYGIKMGAGQEFWPYTGWAYELFKFGDRPVQFWYTVLYTVVMTFFGIQALKRWGLDRRDKFQIWRFSSLITFQWVFFFLMPEFLFQWAIKYQWVGERLAADPQFAEQAWRTYGIVYAWPLFFYTFFYSPHQIWIIWGVVLAFGVIPVFVVWHGKRYCSWICGCGGLAETLGDRWRHLAPKGKASLRWGEDEPGGVRRRRSHHHANAGPRCSGGPPESRRMGRLSLPHRRGHLAGGHPAAYPVSVSGRESLVPLLVPAGEVDGGSSAAAMKSSASVATASTPTKNVSPAPSAPATVW